MKFVEETFYRRAEIGHAARHLPAAIYNLAHILLARAPQACLFVPIRTMQYLAVLDREEFIFVDREGGRFIELAWRGFRVAERPALDAPVAYEAVYYSPGAATIMTRLQGEFGRALRQLEDRHALSGPARVFPILPGAKSCREQELTNASSPQRGEPQGRGESKLDASDESKE